jgi:hypothetical protein
MTPDAMGGDELAERLKARIDERTAELKDLRAEIYIRLQGPRARALPATIMVERVTHYHLKLKELGL